MARTYRILGQVSPTANILSNLYAVPSNNSAIISSITISNYDERSGVTGNAFSISVNAAGSPVTNTNMIAYKVNCPIRDSITLTLGITLNANSIVSVNANGSSMAFSAFGTEIY
jgi:hypothetical protein